MSGSVIAVANMKGGVGKTTTVVSLAEALAADTGASILVIDLDPQASASWCLAGDALLADLIRRGRTLDAFLEQRLVRRQHSNLLPKIRPMVTDTTHGGTPLSVSLLACGPHLRIVEREIIYELSSLGFGMRGVEGQIWKLFQDEVMPVVGHYDYIIFDCAPGISPINEVAIRASDMVVVPTIPDAISTLGLNAFCRSLWGTNGRGLPRPSRLPYVLVTRYQQQVRQHEEILQGMHVEIEEPDAGFCLFKTKIPQAAALAGAMTLVGEAPTFRSKYGAAICEVLDDLVQELKGHLDGNRP